MLGWWGEEGKGSDEGGGKVMVKKGGCGVRRFRKVDLGNREKGQGVGDKKG